MRGISTIWRFGERDYGRYDNAGICDQDRCLHKVTTIEAWHAMDETGGLFVDHERPFSKPFAPRFMTTRNSFAATSAMIVELTDHRAGFWIDNITSRDLSVPPFRQNLTRREVLIITE